LPASRFRPTASSHASRRPRHELVFNFHCEPGAMARCHGNRRMRRSVDIVLTSFAGRGTTLRLCQRVLVPQPHRGQCPVAKPRVALAWGRKALLNCLRRKRFAARHHGKMQEREFRNGAAADAKLPRRAPQLASPSGIERLEVGLGGRFSELAPEAPGLKSVPSCQSAGCVRR
jgi:hypothetical protein